MTGKPPVFGEKGRTGVKFIGDLPFEHRGVCTSTLYVWNERHPDRWVDKRDLPHLVKTAGRENLKSKDIETKKPKEAKQPRQKQGVTND